MEQEKQHYEECRQLILSNLEQYEKQTEELHEKVQELYRLVQNGDVELYNQLSVSASLEEHVRAQRNKNRAALQQPFFGRIDYENLSEDRKESVYIGKNGVMKNRTEVCITDWRAPISSVYYENELGKGSYFLPSGAQMSIDLILKRTYDVQKGELKGFYDSDIASNDELLVQYLSKNKDEVLGDIIATIQKEQNEIIRATPFGNILVQGVAGSGKTTVAMHRISYLLYNYQDRFLPNEYCIVGSNDLLISYITGCLPELDVHDVKQMRMDGLLIHLLEKHWKKQYQLRQVKAAGKYKSKIRFLKELMGYLREVRRQVFGYGEVVDQELGVLLSKESKETTIREQKDASLWQILKLLDERLQKRIVFLYTTDDFEKLRKKKAGYRGYYKDKMPKENIVQLYILFLTQYGQKHRLDMTEEKNDIGGNQFDLYDLCALNIIHHMIWRKKDCEEFGQMFLDEAQDFGGSVYFCLKKVLPDCFFTIMGDVSQNILYDTGLNDWDEIRGEVFCNDLDRFCLLNKSYRNTVEISEYAGTILEKASQGLYKIDPVIRHGLPVQKIFCSRSFALEKCRSLILEIKEKGYDTTAVICAKEEEASMLEKQLGIENQEEQPKFHKGVMVLPIALTKGLEFDTVILYGISEADYVDKPASAKLLYVAVTRALHELYLLDIS